MRGFGFVPKLADHKGGGSPDRTLLIWALLGLAAICSIFGLNLIESYEDVGLQARDATNNIALMVDQDVQRNIALFDLLITGIVDAMGDPKVMQQSPELRRLLLFDRVPTLLGLGAVYVLDDRGQVILNSNANDDRDANYGDRDYFLAHKLGHGSGLFIGHPVRGGLNPGSWYLGLSRPWTRADGTFGGVVAATLNTDFLRAAFEKIAKGKNGAITLFALDGTVMAHAPNASQAMGREVSRAVVFRKFEQAPSGNFETASALDGVERIYTYRQVGTLPLILNVGFARDEVFAGWWRKSSMSGVSILLVVGGVLYLLLAFGKELRRRAVAERALAGMAKTDGLTSLANRRSFDEMLDIEWRRAERDATQFSLLMLDGDFFKSYNDAFGHPEGDKALKAIAKTIRDSILRPADQAARYGGEEFAVLLPETDAQGAVRVAERIRMAVYDLRLQHPYSPCGFATVSIGVATLKPRYADHPSALLRAADHALYEAKAAGRNRVVSARPLDLKMPAKVA